MKYNYIFWSWDEVSQYKCKRPELKDIRAKIARRDELMRAESGTILWKGIFPEYLMEFVRDWCVLPKRDLACLIWMSLDDIKAEYDFWTCGRE